MKLIIGLGNPGRQYERTRHNIGADIITAFADIHHILINRTSLKSEWGRANIEGQSLILARPLTYMNLSGETLIALKNYFKIDIDDILVVVDDFNLPLGKLRFRGQGSAGGHNGLKSIIAGLGSQEFQRMKVGIGSPLSPMAITEFVLGRFNSDEIQKIEPTVKTAIAALMSWVKDGLNITMRAFH